MTTPPVIIIDAVKEIVCAQSVVITQNDCNITLQSKFKSKAAENEARQEVRKILNTCPVTWNYDYPMRISFEFVD